MMLFEPTSPNTSAASHDLEALKNEIQGLNNDVTVVAVSVFGGPHAEEAEIRRRSRFAVVSALSFHHYHPEDADAIGYFHATKPYDDNVPYEWFEKEDRSHSVLVLWLKDEQLTAKPLTTLHNLFNELTPLRPYNGNPHNYGPYNKVNVKLIGPRGSKTLRALVRESQDLKQKPLPLRDNIEVYSPSATISNCDLLNQEDRKPQWDCFNNPPSLLEKTTLPIVRTTSTDHVLAAALLWELWQRGVNRELGYVDPWWTRTFGKGTDKRKCDDGLVLIGERDTTYGRTLLSFLTDGFSDRCGTGKQVRTFNYLRGLDGMLADADKSGSKALPKNDSGKSKDLREQLNDAPPEHAEGRNQFDYLRRLAIEIDRLNQDRDFFAKNGVKAIGIVGSDLYDKLLILQALRSRFKDKIFFTTDLDARYLHADQKDWTRNLVVASSFGLSLRPALQYSTLPFRDSYQTATYLATLMALSGKPFDHWTSKMEKWLDPQIFEIGRTEALHLASPSVQSLKNWIEKHYSEDSVPPETKTTCDGSWVECINIEPTWPSHDLSLDHPWAISLMICFGLLLFALANRRVNETVRAAVGASSSERKRAWANIGRAIVPALMVFIILVKVHSAMQDSIAQGAGEPFVWLEGISTWPNLTIRFVGLLTVLGLWCLFVKKMQYQKNQISEYFELPLTTVQVPNRSPWSAIWTGPHVDLASLEKDGEVTTLWHNYLRATSVREMKWWIGASMMITLVSVFIMVFLWGMPSFPHRGTLVLTLHYFLSVLHTIVFWLIIFWVGYETRACVQFVNTLSGVRNEWPEQLLFRKAKETGIPCTHLDDYLDFQLIVRATQRIQSLIYLPFVSIFALVLARSNFFAAMDIPLPFVLIVGFALTYLLYSARLLRKSAEKMHTTMLKNYEDLQSTPSWPPVNTEQIDRLMSRIRNTHTGVFAPFAQQPALQALLLPFGGYGGVQIIEYLIKLFAAS
jgi:hypothetical protein